MKKIILFSLGAALALVSSCTGGSTGGQAPAVKYYDYGNKPLPGELSELTSTYSPVALPDKTFIRDDLKYTPVDFTTEDLNLTVDMDSLIFTSEASIEFKVKSAARPYFLLDADIKSATLDGIPVTTKTISAPEGVTDTYVVIDKVVSAGTHTLVIDYEPAPEAFAFKSGGFALLTDMSDLPSAHFLESWAPAGFEDDSFALTIHAQVLNSTVPHEVYSNGATEKTADSEWKVTFPDYFTTSSVFFHLTATPLSAKNFTVTGKTRSIPITVYSSNPALVDQAATILPGLFEEFETDYGPYPHDRFVAYLTNSGGGMEYSGATITSLSALDHELFHSWFARGVMPAEGRSGWIDEALASWRDNGYFQAASLLGRDPTMLSAFTGFNRSTPTNCYRDGRRLISELDRLFSDYGGMKPLMKLFFSRYQHRIVTTEEFAAFLSAKTKLNVDTYFKRYTLAQNVPDATTTEVPDVEEFQDNVSKHPQPLTQKEIKQLR